MTRLFRLGYLLIVVPLLFTSCASLRDSRTQTLLLQSRPAGATIYRDGVEVGQTPNFVDVKRGGTTAVSLKTKRGVRALPLRKHYRWRASFWPNFVWSIGAPVAWAVDLITGAAYEYEPLAVTTVNLDRADLARPRATPVPVAVAPPQSDEPAISDAGGAALEQDLRARGIPTRPYGQTLPTFAAAGYDFDGAPPDFRRPQMYRDLRAGAVVESVIERRDDHLVVRPTRNDFFDQRLTKQPDVPMEGATSLDRVFTRDRWWSRLLPNLVAVDLASSRLELSYPGGTYALAVPKDGGFTERALGYLSAIKITSQPARRLDRSSTFSLSLVPTLRASARSVTATALPARAGGSIDQRYWRGLIGGGYGPEAGFQSGRHYTYLNVLPMVAWTRVSSEDRVSSGFNLSAAVELGYLYYLGKHWNVRVFSRSQEENGDVWRRALAERVPATSAVTGLMSGLSIGYRFEPSTRRASLTAVNR